MASQKSQFCKMDCEHCNNGSDHIKEGDKCCWASAMEIKKFRNHVKHKYIFEVLIDMIISTTSVATDIIALVMYCVKRKYAFALITAIPVILPTFVFTNVYLTDESSKKNKKVSRVVSVIGDDDNGEGGEGTSRKPSLTRETSCKEKLEQNEQDPNEGSSNFDSESTDSGIRPLDNKGSRCMNACLFHWSCCCAKPVEFCKNCFKGCSICLCNRDLRLRRRGVIMLKNNFQRLFKYGIGTIVLRVIAWMWYVKALIFGIKAYREPKRFMHITAPDKHWSYELLIRLDFLQAALENAPQCVIQLYALITQSDEDVVLGLLTLIFSFIDFIRVSVSVHWDMHKGPVAAPSGCYRTLVWKMINTSSWVLIYSSRSAALALVLATSGVSKLKVEILFPAIVFTIHILIFGKLLSKAEYGVAAQKILVSVFISLFFLPELDLSVNLQIIQLYYATIIIQNSLFVIPWNGFEMEYCITSQGIIKRPPDPTPGPAIPSPPANFTTDPPMRTTKITLSPPITIWNMFMQITPSTTPELEEHQECLIDPVWISLAVPSMTILGVVFRLLSSQRMSSYKNKLPEKDLERDKSQDKLEASITKLFSKHWTQMTFSQLLNSFLRMLKKEVIIVDQGLSSKQATSDNDGDGGQVSGNKRVSFLGTRLQADFLASQTFIRESFSLMTRSTRSHDVNIGQRSEKSGDEQDSLPEYNSDSELTFRSRNVKKRPRIPRSRNVSESLDIVASASSDDTTIVQVDLPNGTQFLEMCWI